MNLNDRFQQYQEHVKQTLNQASINQVDLNCILVFKALAELTLEQESGDIDSLALIDRQSLQERMSECYPATGNERRQEVNKYLSQRFRVAKSIEPDFIAFTIASSKKIQTRSAEIKGGTQRLAYQIRKFDDRDKLLEYLSSLNFSSNALTGRWSPYSQEAITSPLNQILYGPPGTGKTYHTIEAAVKAAEPETYADLKIDEKLGADSEQRAELTQLYKELCSEGRIRFVTFHQSYGYEEFVIGLTARTQGEQIAYFEKDGVFKEICDESKNNSIKSKQSATELDEEFKFEQALTNFKEAMFDEADSFALTESVSITFIEETGFRYGGESWQGSQIMKYDDLRLLYLHDVDTRQGIKKSDFVSGLAKQHASYFIRALEAIKKYIPESSSVSTSIEKQNYCLIIDEINRGNISKIFGELITLIEPSKRLGNKEALEVILPHSGKPFSVPNNLYLIGTMNTADRSLAMMDTALRRLFDFKELIPNPKLFEGKKVNDINLQQLLTTMNDRIEVLYDREHTLGHAFLMPVLEALDGTDEVAGDEQQAFIELQNAFKNKIIPLLEEYFYEDWNKIRLVLGDSLKKNDEHKFIKQTESSFSDLFGAEHGLDLYEDKQLSYKIKAFGKGTVWDKAQAYIEIYSLTKKPVSES